MMNLLRRWWCGLVHQHRPRGYFNVQIHNYELSRRVVVWCNCRRCKTALYASKDVGYASLYENGRQALEAAAELLKAKLR